ncbi:MAG: hypothetical protein WDW38_007131 [Sanguina aurantia]
MKEPPLTAELLLATIAWDAAAAGSSDAAAAGSSDAACPPVESSDLLTAPDIRSVLKDTRKQVLAGVTIAFSGVEPSPAPAQQAQAQAHQTVTSPAADSATPAGTAAVDEGLDPNDALPVHPLWALARCYGAVCERGVTEATTHVVACYGGTKKVLWALQHGRHVVTPAW